MYRRWLDRLGFVSIVAGVFALGLVRGQLVFVLQFEVASIAGVIVLVEAVFSSITFTLFTIATGLLFLWDIYRDDPSIATTDAGELTAIVPVYGDARVMHRSVESLLESNYEDLSVLIVVEEDDGVSRRRAEELAERNGVEYLVNTKYPGSKSGAINYAAETVDSDYLAVFDADEIVDPDFVPGAMSKIEDGAEIVQGRTVPEPEGFVESLAYAESVLLSYAARRFLYLFTGFRMAASRAVVMRRSALETVGGYDEDMLTEDFAFAYECYKERVDVAEQLSYPSRIEGAHNVQDWWGQRKRWMTGYAQVFHRLVTSIRPLDDYRNVLSAGLCLMMVSGSLLLLSFLSKFVLLLLMGEQLFFALPLVAAVSLTVGFAALDKRRGTIQRIPLTLVLVPLILPFYSLAALKAVTEYLFTWQGDWYSVSKGLD